MNKHILLSGGKSDTNRYVANSEDPDQMLHSVMSGPEVIKLFSCSTQLSMKFSLLINMKMPT